jgi:hypothetical protein
LIQVVTVNRLTGYRTEPATFTVGKGDGAYQVEGEQIVRIGVPPFRIANTLVSLVVRNSRLTKATVLDINGYPTSKVEINRGRVRLPKNAVYVVLSAN